MLLFHTNRGMYMSCHTNMFSLQVGCYGNLKIHDAAQDVHVSRMPDFVGKTYLCGTTFPDLMESVAKSCCRTNTTLCSPFWHCFHLAIRQLECGAHTNLRYLRNEVEEESTVRDMDRWREIMESCVCLALPYACIYKHNMFSLFLKSCIHTCW